MLVTSFGVLGCPSDVDPALARPAPTPVAVDESDPRVVRDSGDLYPATAVARPEPGNAQADGAAGLGSGRPDETNGVCRLYAPRLPRPTCCNADYGFDVATIQRACGLDVYLGESLQGSCGYYFHQDAEPPTRSYFRMSFVAGRDPKEAADSHDAKLAQSNPGFHSDPIPGIEGAYWSGLEGVNWAFLPGWDKVRQLTWRDTICSRETMLPVIRDIISAHQPARGTPRAGLVPTAKKQG